MFEIHVGELRATFLRNHNMKCHEVPQAEDSPSRQLKHRRPPQPPQSRQPPQARGAAPDTGRCTRYVAVHLLCGAAPEQKRCIAYGSGALPLRTSESVVGACRGDCVAQWGGLPRRRCVWIGGHDRPREGAADPRHRCVWTGVQGASSWRCTRYVAVHPLRGAAPVTWRRTRTEGV